MMEHSRLFSLYFLETCGRLEREIMTLNFGNLAASSAFHLTYYETPLETHSPTIQSNIPAPSTTSTMQTHQSPSCLRKPVVEQSRYVCKECLLFEVIQTHHHFIGSNEALTMSCTNCNKLTDFVEKHFRWRCWVCWACCNENPVTAGRPCRKCKYKRDEACLLKWGRWN